MGLFNRTKTGKVTDAVDEDKSAVKNNVAAVNKLEFAFAFSSDFCVKLSEFKTGYGFSSPKSAPETLKADKKIGVLLDDLGLCAQKAEKSGDLSEAERILKKIRMTAAER